VIYYVSTPTGERCLAECRRYGFREMSCPRSTKRSKFEIARVQRETDVRAKFDSKMADQRRREAEERAALDETITEWLRLARREAEERIG
jgi:hypothetical protein